MSWSLVRHDPAWRALPATVPIALLVGVLLRLATLQSGDLPLGLGTRAPANLGPGFAMLVAVFTVHGFTVLFPANFATRCSRLDLVLPLSTRRLWIARLFSLAVVAMLPMLLFAAALSVYRDGAGAWSLDTGLLLLGVKAALCLVLAVVLLQSPSPGLHRNRATPEYVFAVGLTALGTAIYVVFSPQNALGLLLPPLVALLLAATVYRRLPAAFGLAAAQPEEVPTPPATVEAPEPHSTADWDAVRSAPSRWLVHRVVGRTLHLQFLSVMLLVILAIYGLVIGDSYHSGRVGLHWSIFLLGMMLNYAGLAIRRLHRVDALPLSRRVLFAHVMLPPLVAVGLGAALFDTIQAVAPHPEAQIRFEESKLLVPKDCWEIAEGDGAPTVTAPWGESHTPRVRHAVGRGGPAVYDPFEIPADASAEFVAWQIARAVAVVHGDAPPAAERPELSGAEREAIEYGEMVVTASAGRDSTPRSRTFLVYLAVWWVLIVLHVALAIEPHRGTTRPKLYLYLLVGLIVALVAIMVGFVIFGESSLADADAASAWFMIQLRGVAEAIPLGLGAMQLLALALLAVGYLFLQWRFEGIEVSRQMEKKQWGQEY